MGPHGNRDLPFHRDVLRYGHVCQACKLNGWGNPQNEGNAEQLTAGALSTAEGGSRFINGSGWEPPLGAEGSITATRGQHAAPPERAAHGLP